MVFLKMFIIYLLVTNCNVVLNMFLLSELYLYVRLGAIEVILLLLFLTRHHIGDREYYQNLIIIVTRELRMVLSRSRQPLCTPLIQLLESNGMRDITL